MPCPYFYPLHRQQDPGWEREPRWPLRALFDGECRACASEPRRPENPVLQESCNRGYARGRCAEFPADPGSADAVRFSVVHVREEDSEAAEGGSRLITGPGNGPVRLIWVLEKNYAPLEHGELEYDPARDVITPTPENPILARQVKVFLQSYLEGLRRPGAKAAGRG